MDFLKGKPGYLNLYVMNHQFVISLTKWTET
eukprot:COSAG04_NODE_10452_length_776_cov_1.002954_1_plen_30_part_10